DDVLIGRVVDIQFDGTDCHEGPVNRDQFAHAGNSDMGHFRAHGVPCHGTTHACRAREVERKLSNLMALLPPAGSSSDRAANLVIDARCALPFDRQLCSCLPTAVWSLLSA